MDIPPPDQWLSFRQAAAYLGVSYHQIYHAANRGRKVQGEIVKLPTYRTAGGLVTTRRDLSLYHSALNSRK